MRFLLIILIALLLFTGCRHTASDPAIRHAEMLADSLPREALAILDGIPDSSLSQHDLFLHRYLTIKAKDELLVKHSTDSIMKLVLEYAENNRRSVNYPEVLYYAGRVYSDMGDYPGALEYFHNSLNEVSKSENLELEAKLLSQISSIYFSCYFYDEAEDYINRTIKLDSILCDTLSLIYDMMDLAKIHYNRNDYNSASNIHNQIVSLSHTSYPKIEAEQYADLARIKMQQGQTDSAMTLIARSINNVEGEAKNKAIASAAEIYMITGKPDSAYIYATELIRTNSPQAISRGYHILLNPLLSAYVSKDSIYSYISALSRSEENMLSKNSLYGTLIESSRYNYEIHQRERFLAIQKYNNFVVWLANLIVWWSVVIIILLIAGTVILFFRLKNKQQKLELLTAEKTIQSLTAELTKYDYSKVPETIDIAEQKKIIKASILRQAEILSQHDNQENLKNLQRTTSPELMDCLMQNKEIPHGSCVWDELLNNILKVSPRFKSNLEVLTEGQLSMVDLEIAILVKYDLSMSAITKILGRSKQAIHSRRQYLGKKIFNDNFNVKDVDALIKVL